MSVLGEDGAVGEPRFKRLDSLYSDPCLSPPVASDTTVVVASVLSGAFEVASPVTVTAPEPGTRVVQAGDGWAVLAGPHLLITDAVGTLRHDVAISD